jgi:hypothetical protein
MADIFDILARPGILGAMEIGQCTGLRCNHLARVGTSARTATPCLSVHNPGPSFSPGGG